MLLALAAPELKAILLSWPSGCWDIISACTTPSGWLLFLEIRTHGLALAGLELTCRPGWLWTSVGIKACATLPGFAHTYYVECRCVHLPRCTCGDQNATSGVTLTSCLSLTSGCGALGFNSSPSFGFCVGTGDPNSNPYTYTASTLPTEPSFQHYEK